MFRCLFSEIWPFYEIACPWDKIRKCPYLGLESIKCKNKVTLISQTLKVEEKKVPLFFWSVAQEPRYSHFIFRSSGSGVCSIIEGRRCQYLTPGPWIKKPKITFFSSTFKVWESKVSYVFDPSPRVQDIGIYSPLMMVHTSLLDLQKMKWPYLGSWATNQKNKVTFFSSTFKVSESKVPSVFSFLA